MTMNADERGRANALLDKSLPTYRQAYSDRTAWLMACLSELAYLRFNPLFSSGERQEWFIENLSRLIDDGRKASLLKLIDSVAYDPEEEPSILKESLSSLRLELSATFDMGGTQAILVSGGSFIALAFRGTEATSIRDIKADARANKRACESGGKMHSGFYDAFEQHKADGRGGDRRRKACGQAAVHHRAQPGWSDRHGGGQETGACGRHRGLLQLRVAEGGG